jgi:c-di-GMP-binding flagellar brake protein YcgR
MMVDRRRAERERRGIERVRATFAVKMVADGGVVLAQCEDVGTTGITLRRAGGQPVPVGTPIKICFSLPDDRTVLTAYGEVVTDRSAGYFRRTGLRFSRISPEASRRLSAFFEGRQTHRATATDDQHAPG